MSAPRIIVLTKEPTPGRVKTRLAPTLGAAGAARLHAALVDATLDLALSTGLPVELCLAGDLGGAFAARARRRGVAVREQVEGDLGARLTAALAGPGRRVALGTDCVTFKPSWLVQAVRRPEAALFGASNDGGYWAACVEGTGGPSQTEQLFADIPWSRPDTLDATLRAAAAAGIEVGPLPPCFDVDDAADLRRLLADPRCPAAVRALGRELSARPGSAG